MGGDASGVEPYRVGLTIKGTATLLLHAYDVDAVATKATAAKGSRGKKEDDIESYLHRDADGCVVIPATYLHACLRDAGKSMQDPRSPRKSMFDLLKAAIVVCPDYLVLRNANGEKATTWDALDKRRAVVQRSCVTRSRPAFLAGWEVDAVLDVLLPEYLPESLLLRLVSEAGRVTGLADFRPQFGRYGIARFTRLD